jgi:hypothetical protein
MPVPVHTAYYIEIVTADVEAAHQLYGTAYVWFFEAKGPEWGNSFVAELPDGSLCGIRGPLHD